MRKIIKWTGIVLGGLIGLALLAGLLLYPIGMKSLTRPYPSIAVEMVNIPTDPAAVAHGRHIAIVWACTKCHGENLSGALCCQSGSLLGMPAGWIIRVYFLRHTRLAIGDLVMRLTVHNPTKGIILITERDYVTDCLHRAVLVLS